MLPPADFPLAKIVAEIITSKQKVLRWSIGWRSDFDGAETLGDILESEGTQRFLRLFVVKFSFNDCCWRDFASSSIFSRRYCVRYRCNRPLLYLTEEHSIRWKFCLVNKKLFHLIWSASENQSVRNHRRRNPTFEDQRKLTTCRRVQKCTEEYFSQCMEMCRKNYFESHLGGQGSAWCNFEPNK